MASLLAPYGNELQHITAAAQPRGTQIKAHNLRRERDRLLYSSWRESHGSLIWTTAVLAPGFPTGSYPENASAVSDAPCLTPEICLPLTTGRVRYSCLKEAGEEESMQIQWGCGDEKDLGNG